MVKRGFLFLITFLITLISPGQVIAESKEFNSTQDTYANLAYPDAVNSSQTPITISNKNTTRLGYVQFEDIDLPEGAVIDSAILKIYVYTANYADEANLTLGPIDVSWDEDAVSWNSKPAANTSKSQNNEISIADTGWKEISVTDLVRQWYDGTLDNFGLYIFPINYLQPIVEPPFAIAFKSRDSSDNQVRLKVNYHVESTPTPTEEPTVEPTEALDEEPVATDEADESEVLGAVDEEEIEKETETEEEEDQKFPSTFEVVAGSIIVLGLLLGGVGLALYFKNRKDETEERENERE